MAQDEAKAPAPGAEGKEVKKKGDKGKEPENPDEDLSDEDLLIKQKLESAVERAQSDNAAIQKEALEYIKNDVRSSTTSMTAEPKPLRFLRPHYATLKAFFESKVPEGSPNRPLYAAVLSVLAMTSARPEDRESLRFCLASGDVSFADQWGHEYLRHLAGEIASEYDVRVEAGGATEDLMGLVRVIVPEHMQNNAEPEAVDLLLEVEAIDLVVEHASEQSCQRTCLYLVSCAAYLPAPENVEVLECAYKVHAKFGQWVDAARVALKLDSRPLVEGAFVACRDEIDRKQIMYLLARQGFVINVEEGPCAVEDATLRDQLRAIMGNAQLSEHFLALARDLDVVEAKTPEDVYKSHLVDGRAPVGPSVDSARQNLANTFVSALVNAGFGHDKLVLPPEAGGDGAGSSEAHWIYKNREHGKLSAAASLGLVMLWDVDNGLSKIDRFMYTSDPHITAGACLAVGVVSSSVRHEMDPALALLSDKLSADQPEVRERAVLGLGLAYAGTAREEVADLLGPIAADPGATPEVASLALGMVFVGTMHDGCAAHILQGLMMRSDVDLGLPLAPLAALGLALLFLGRQEAAEPTLEITRTLSPKIAKFAETLTMACAYAGTGSVLRVQSLLALCGQAPGKEGERKGEGEGEKREGEGGDEAGGELADQLVQGVAVLGVALVAMGEELGSKMAQRSFDHVLQYCGPAARRAVPLAVALLNVSSPDMLAMDVLSRLSHDADGDVAMGACLGLGLMGAGTNNARLANMLRQLSSYFYKEPSCLFLTRVSQGLVHLGKGLLTLSPHHSDRLLLSGQGVAGLLAVLVASLQMKATLAGRHHPLLYCLAPAMHPRMFMPVSPDGAIIQTPARVGEAVDVVAQAGRPKAITGFQTHTTPVLLAVGERAELATEKYLPRSSVLEGLVICVENPDYVEEVHEKHAHG